MRRLHRILGLIAVPAAGARQGRRGTVDVLGEGREIDVREGKLEDRFGPCEAHHHPPREDGRLQP